MTSSPPVRLTVSQVRVEMYGALRPSFSENDRSAEPSTPLLGTLFHQIAQQLTATSPTGESFLDFELSRPERDLNVWKSTLVQRVYDCLLAPLIEHHQISLASQTNEMASFWISIQELCCWMADLRWHWTQGGTRETPTSEWICAEQELSIQFSSSSNTLVLLEGIADALIKRPDGCWCVLEYKLGKASPEADLLQGCLYHWMQSQQAGRKASGNCGLAMIHFGPERQETLFASGDVSNAQQKLLALIDALVQKFKPASLPPKPVATKPETTELQADIEEIKKRLIAAFRQFQIEIRLDQPPIIGPTFLRFPVTLGRKVKLSQILRLDADIGVRLGLESPPSIHVEKGNLVIDIMRPDRQTVYFRDYLNQMPQGDLLLGSALAPVGVDLNGQLVSLNFASPASPHLLVAGGSGSGKSEWLISALSGLMCQNTPDTLRFVIIDPKRNGFLWMEDSPFLEGSLIFPDEQDVCEVLLRWIDEMERRYRLFESDRDLTTYIKRTGQPCPRIVIVIDEFQNLLESAGDRKEIERLISRLGTKARAAGIHMILATQQPNRKTISGQIAANFPARVGLKTASGIESRVLLEETGAENLLGNGDLYFRDIGDKRRLQALYIEQDERAEYVRSGTVPITS